MKVLNALTGGSGQRCYLCNATTSKFNEIVRLLEQPIEEEHLQLGFPILHAKIRTMESVLRVSEKAELQRHSVNISSNTKRLYQQQLCSRMISSNDCLNLFRNLYTKNVTKNISTYKKLTYHICFILG